MLSMCELSNTTFKSRQLVHVTRDSYILYLIPLRINPETMRKNVNFDSTYSSVLSSLLLFYH